MWIKAVKNKFGIVFLSLANELGTSFESLTGVERGMKNGLMKTSSFKEEDFPCTQCEPPSNFIYNKEVQTAKT